MKVVEQQVALDLLRRHPGWSDPRVADELAKRKLHASPSSVQFWRVDAGLAPATKDVGNYPPPRVAGIPLACGHLAHPEQVHEDGPVAHCHHCSIETRVLGP